MVEIINVKRFGTSKKMIPLPTELQNELEVRDELMVKEVNREKNEITLQPLNKLKLIEEIDLENK